MNKTIPLDSPNISRTLFKLALPAVVANVCNLLYSLVDKIFIGMLPNGINAMAGIGVTLPLALLVSSFSLLVGMGGASLQAIALGKRDYEEAENILANGFILLLIIAAVLSATLFLFKDQLLYILGASEATIGYASDYLGMYLLGTPFILIVLGMSPYVNAQGFTKVSMVAVMIGAISNIVFDVIFIFGLGMGVRGAGLATVFAQFLAMLWIMRFLFRDEAIVKIKISTLRLKKDASYKILALGVSPLIIQSTEFLVMATYNRQLLQLGGDVYIALFAVMHTLMMLVGLPIMGISKGAAPLISFNYGAKNYDRVRAVIKLYFVIVVGYLFVYNLLLMLFPQPAVSIFQRSPEILQIAPGAIRIYFFVLILSGVQMVCQQTFIAMKKPKQAIFLGLLRRVVLVMPLIYLLPVILPESIVNPPNAALMAVPIADIITTIVAAFLFAKLYRKELLQESDPTVSRCD
ncbi:MAG: MATE family efflux transporter [Defluviitaleaceae bacterium]|nr:MATE family efflux transporter [Defluviitaleaceae bacterium]